MLFYLAAAPTLAHAQSPPALQSLQSPHAHTPLVFPRDFGVHPSFRTEWWYMTGSLQSGARAFGFQVTFFRSATGIDGIGTDRGTDSGPDHSTGAGSGKDDDRSRFTPSQLLFAHAALTDLQQRRLRHDQRIARSGFGIAEASRSDTAVTLRDWRMTRSTSPATGQNGQALSRYAVHVTSESAGFGFDFEVDATQPVLLQGDAGWSQKGPDPVDFSRYYSEPQLAVRGKLIEQGRSMEVTGRAWLDHEWSDAYVPAQAVGWDWIGMNLNDGSALTAFRLRRADGTAVYAGGSFRRASKATQTFGPDAVRFVPGRIWESAASRASYPVTWQIDTPAGRFGVDALLDDQELDSRGSTGSIYWEGISGLRDAGGRNIGRGYLEMTGYAAPLRL